VSLSKAQGASMTFNGTHGPEANIGDADVNDVSTDDTVPGGSFSFSYDAAGN
jgi:hypothetical protein